MGPEEIWTQLRRPSAGLNARPHAASAEVWLALDPQNRRHLLVRAPEIGPGELLMSTRGLSATTDTLALEGQPEEVWVDIVCLEPAMDGTFATVSNDLSKEILLSPDNPVQAVRRTLNTWQWFWGVDPDSLSRSAALGLMSELWFIDRWARFPEVIPTWTGPTGNRYDFVSPIVSIEAKGTQVRTDGSSRHRISNLDQLADPESGSLYIFSLQAIPDLNAKNNLSALVQRLRGRLASRPDLLTLFDRRLGEAGWTPMLSERPEQQYRVVAEELYAVKEQFPRLTRESFPSGLPSGVDDVRYTIDLATCTGWRVATSPAQAADILAQLRL